MRPKILLVTIIFTTIFLILAGCSASTSARDPDKSPTDGQDALVELANDTSNTSTLVPATADLPASQAAPLLDGQSLLERHCARCHMLKLIQQVEKSRSDWEKTLEQMAALGVQIDESEKDVLLNYLSR